MINIGYDVDVTKSDAERLIKWFEMPEGKLFILHLKQQIDLEEDKIDSSISDNPVSELLARERAIAARLTMKSILKWPQDISDLIKQDGDNRNNLTDNS